MSKVWWGKESEPSSSAADGFTLEQPELLLAARDKLVSELQSRRAGFTPDWHYLGQDDPGFALVRLFSEMLEPVAQRANRLPEKALVEFLSMTGISPLPPRPAAVALVFEVANTAIQAVLVGEGFQVGAAGTDGNRVVFETQRSFHALPTKLEQLYSEQSGIFQALENNGDTAFLPFGNRAVPGRALYLGFTGTAQLGPSLSLGIRVATAPGTPPPASRGGLTPLPVPPAPRLRWEILDGAQYQTLEVAMDETQGLFRSGIVELRLPRLWRTGQPGGLVDAPVMRWLRLKILVGEYQEPPRLWSILPNMVSALAVHTHRNEILTPVSDGESRYWRLSATPVLAGSLVLEVDEGDLNAGIHPWKEEEDLSDSGPEDRVFTLDSASGVVSFGDGINGKAAPIGFRHIRAVSYRVGGGTNGAVEAGAISNLLNSAPFVRSAKNPQAATGGADQEPQAQALQRGPQEIRARRRAVTVADYPLLALRTVGANVARAHAVSGLHPSYPGAVLPGVVGVFIVPPDRGEGAPIPDEGSLDAVAKYLSEFAAPAGVEVVAAAPRYQSIKLEIGLVLTESAPVAETVGQVLQAVNRYLHPILGGDEGNGWPFGGTLRYPVLLRLIVNQTGVHAVPRLNIVLDGVRLATCQDQPIAAHALLWPEGHEVFILQGQDSP